MHFVLVRLYSLLLKYINIKTKTLFQRKNILNPTNRNFFTAAIAFIAVNLNLRITVFCLVILKKPTCPTLIPLTLQEHCTLDHCTNT